MNHKSFVISNRPHLFEPIKKSISPESVNYFDGAGYPSFSKLVNSCVASANAETVIVMSDKVMPTNKDVTRLLGLLDQGFALVALYRLAFFGFRKQLLRDIGMFDERYVGGGFEDDDFYIRLKEANMGVYITHEIPYTKSVSGWNYNLAQGHFINKWNNIAESGEIKRILPEEQYTYNLGPAAPVEFLPWHKSVIQTNKVKKYTKYPIVK
jgi:GT2 family glycosyltransferase